ncbi:MAG: Hsp20/alpha crystallin family protein [Candidatus Lambdaproteobacteria bacterium]|nr:Hsp20/alpha crystallin family protein [Candidatus Lambdaproteobacteria bacterium]
MFGLVPFDTRWADSAFDRFFSDFAPLLSESQPSVAQAVYVPRVDIREDGEALVLSAEIPGIDKDAVKVEVQHKILTISGEKTAEQISDKGGVHRSERVYGAFKRSFRLPESVDGNNVDASYKDGILTVRLAKRPESKPRQIAVTN